MAVVSSAVGKSAQAEQRKLEKLCSWAFIVGGAGTLIAGLFDSRDGLFTAWDDYGATLTSILYFVSGLLIYRRPQWLAPAVLLSAIPTAIYQQGVMFLAVHQPGSASLYSAIAAGPFFPLFYVVLFISLPKGASTLSLIQCAGFYLQFLLNATWLAEPFPSPGRQQAEHLLLEAMMAHPAYIVALNYIVKLRERLFAARQETFKQKEGFLGMLSHEIRNQLQTMVGAIELLELKLNDPAQQRSIARLQKATAQLQTYLHDINELTTLEDPTLRIERKPFDLDQLLADVSDEWLERARSQGLQLSVRPPASGLPLRLDSDEARLRQVLSNLVSNALKYTQTGSVTIDAKVSAESPGSAMIEVIDTGVGIEEKYLERIFLPHVRLENAASDRSEGSGLGLTIVERLVASLGGSLRVESRVGRGTRFKITVPGLIGQREASSETSDKLVKHAALQRRHSGERRNPVDRRSG